MRIPFMHHGAQLQLANRNILLKKFIVYLWIFSEWHPPPLSRDRRGRGGAMNHSINRLFPLLTIHRVGVEVVNCQACLVDCVFQPCGTGPSSSPLAIHWPLQDSRRKVACSICVPVELHFSLLYYCQQWIVETHNWCNLFSNRYIGAMLSIWNFEYSSQTTKFKGLYSSFHFCWEGPCFTPI